MNAIEPYAFGEQALRIVDHDGALWFVAVDVCGALGIASHRDAIARLDDDERGSVQVDTPGGRQAVAAINESGLYRLALSSRKAEAQRFRKWVTAEVIPSIRRKGSYALRGGSIDLSDPATLHRLLLDHTGRAVALEARAAELEPKAAALERLAGAEGDLCVTDAAKALNIPPRSLFNRLENEGWIFRRAGSGHWVGFQAKISSGLITHRVKRIEGSSGPRMIEQVLITPRGLAKLAEERG